MAGALTSTATTASRNAMLRRCVTRGHPLRYARSVPVISPPLSRRLSTPPDPSSSPLAIQSHFASSVGHAFGTLGRLFTFGLIGLVTTGVVVGTAFEGAHFWVEHIGLKPETDEEAKKWEWNVEMERWTGGPSGGTDGALGFKGAHALRSAWQVLHWGLGTPVPGSNVGHGAGALGGIDPALEHAQSFLAIAHNIALDRRASARTQVDLLTRLADVMERIGTPDALYEARAELEDVWARIESLDSADEHERARVALKLGELNRRLGAPDTALSWWAKALHMVSGSPLTPTPPLPVLPAAPPTSPADQRTLARALVALSAFHATRGALREARDTELRGLELLRAVPAPESFGSATPPQALHSLFVIHRAALLSVHLAEVSHALRSRGSSEESLGWLARAAESSERVARVLTGVQLKTPLNQQKEKEWTNATDVPRPPMDRPLLKAFEDSPSMSTPARGLLRDARLSAAESWHLLGLLQEKASEARALACYERAIAWAGAEAGGSEALGKEWKALQANHARVKERLEVKTVDAAKAKA
ncbi:hypothetical protein PENSPDRAFT_656182 [Peniophora sp. CONT]|nr:hypothetical protein PENSPDRAFT_656182 [Peniophora sp. CONT]